VVSDFSLLREDWTYINIWWNDVDFALLLGFLVVGQRAAAKCKSIFKVFRQLREEEVVKPRSEGCGKGSLTCWGIAVFSFAAMAVSGGALAPVTAPLFATACTTGLGCGVAASAIRYGEMKKRCRRFQACRDLVHSFPQLRTIFGTQHG
jgi:hypothetical protein